MDLNQPIEKLPYIGPKYLERLKRLKIQTLKDLLFHFPHRYEDFTNFKKISQLKIGEEATIEGIIKTISSRKSFRRYLYITEALIEDSTGTIRAIWFNQPYLEETLKPGTLVSLAGKIKSDQYGILFSNPSYEKIKKEKELKHTKGLVPIYPQTEGLSSKWLRFVLHPLLKKYSPSIQEYLPREVLKRKKLPEIKKALFEIHFPKTKKEAEKARKRFAFEEIFLVQLIFQLQKKKLSEHKAPKIIPKPEYIEEFKKKLNFEFTEDQKKAIREILNDLQKEIPMSRLLEGEVGCGKTIVATLACFVCAKNGYQSTIMAPTEILAEQHFNEVSKLTKNLNIALITSNKAKVNKKNKKIKPEEIIEKNKKGEIDILIGTHSLIQERVKFKNLGLVVIDEQHRFGVEQRAKLCQGDKNKKEKLIPHFLSMTATPIPRTLALTFYGDLAISQIKELPKGRKKIETKIVLPSHREEVYQFVKKEINSGRQAFIVCPLIEESEKLEVKSAKKEFEKLQKNIFPNLKLGLLHGKMKGEEKEKIMKNFKEGKIDILVTTPVVEVGIDVPNATVIIIEGAERFGLAQLYQFRGRVGRGDYKSYCFLFTESTAKKTWQRLNAILTAKNAFELAEKDLKIRGPGEFIGKRQWGTPDLTMASLTDIELIKEAKEEVEKIISEDPYLKKYPSLKEKLEEFNKEVFLE